MEAGNACMDESTDLPLFSPLMEDKEESGIFDVL
jgi:hypothetical protein